ncbi:uncharacterized protein LOC100905037 isoform X1 [Galendromus occidentalis]|uniref:Uncharacterized protein LOC100905037 isoform X1 n=1 Tax=Galendromus occidentalis TaxID=34638 RepID=A0AAJ6QQL7_9ACAR|nr:uncharacterized protein LOC100905037 isoform X1 [Galendromus occidentalis]
MKAQLLAVLVAAAGFAVSIAIEAYDLPDGAELIVGPIKTTFKCPEKYGYWADVDNDCKIFHICHPVDYPDGKHELFTYSFFCGNQTVFNQLTFTCTWPEEAVACANSPEFFYLNDRLGVKDAKFLTFEDIEKAKAYIPLYNGQANTLGSTK